MPDLIAFHYARRAIADYYATFLRLLFIAFAFFADAPQRSIFSPLLRCHYFRCLPPYFLIFHAYDTALLLAAIFDRFNAAFSCHARVTPRRPFAIFAYCFTSLFR